MNRLDAAFIGVLAAASVLIFLAAPGGGQFWWSEAPRNALNGAFIMDLLYERPFDDPRQWAPPGQHHRHPVPPGKKRPAGPLDHLPVPAVLIRSVGNAGSGDSLVFSDHGRLPGMFSGGPAAGT